MVDNISLKGNNEYEKQRKLYSVYIYHFYNSCDMFSQYVWCVAFQIFTFYPPPPPHQFFIILFVFYHITKLVLKKSEGIRTSESPCGFATWHVDTLK